jgi:hypothetical protein
MIFDPFKDGYSLVQLSEAINLLPNMYSRVGGLGLFSFKPQTNQTVTIEMKNGVLALVPMTAWGGQPPKNTSGKRNLRSFNIPHTPFEDTVMAADVMGVRVFGSENTLEAVNQKVNDKLQEMKNKIDQTMEFRKFMALKGYLMDADLSIVENYFTAFGVTEKVVFFDLDNTAVDPREKCMEIVRHIEDNAQGEVVSGVHSLVSGEFFDKLIKHPKVRDAYLGWAEAKNALGGDLRKGFTWGGVMFEEYRAVVDGQRFIDAGEGHCFPLGTQQTFANYGAPADFVETVNTIALPYYARQQNKDFNRGIDLHVQANQMPMVARPALIVRVSSAAA